MHKTFVSCEWTLTGRQKLAGTWNIFRFFISGEGTKLLLSLKTFYYACSGLTQGIELLYWDSPCISVRRGVV